MRLGDGRRRHRPQLSSNVGRQRRLGVICMNPEEFYRPIEAALQHLPHLRTQLPQDFPRTLDPDEAIAYEKIRTKRFPHNINLPLSCHNVGSRPFWDSRFKFFEQVLVELEAFCARFQHVPRISRVLRPLWAAPFDPNDPALWSVLAHVRICVRLEEAGHKVESFEHPTGHGKKTADIYLRDRMIEIEVWNRTPVAPLDELLQIAEKRAQAKALDKFGLVERDASAVVVEVAFIQGPMPPEISTGASHEHQTFVLKNPPNSFGQIMVVRTNHRTRPSGYAFHLAGEQW